jgi:hypothetical protein
LVIGAACTVKASGAVCVKLPDVPVKVTVDVAPAVAIPAVNVVLCATPGVRFNVAGFAVTPAGSPVIATATVPVNELIAPAVTLTKEPAAPPTIVNDVGDNISEKSDGDTEIVIATVAEWLSAPEVPVRVNVAFPAPAFAAAVTVTV